MFYGRTHMHASRCDALWFNKIMWLSFMFVSPAKYFLPLSHTQIFEYTTSFLFHSLPLSASNTRANFIRKMRFSYSHLEASCAGQTNRNRQRRKKSRADFPWTQIGTIEFLFSSSPPPQLSSWRQKEYAKRKYESIPTTSIWPRLMKTH